MKNLFLLSLFLLFTQIVFAQESGLVKYSNRENSAKVAFFYVNQTESPTEVYFRAASDKNKIKMEIVSKPDEQGDFKVRHPQTKITYLMHVDALIISTSIGDNQIVYHNEMGFESGDEKIYAQLSPIGYGAIYYMPSSQVAPQELKVSNLEEAMMNGEPYQCVFPNGLGKAKMSLVGENLEVTFANGKKKIFRPKK